jgi:RNA polymerase sigma-70 factor (ECF subfamily)
MSDLASFEELIRRVRTRDEAAAADLVRRYESAIRVAVRVRLTDRALRRTFDSMDVCQSVLANFFMRASSGQFEIDRPEQLLKLLVTMARNKVINHARQERAARRDYRRVEGGADAAAVADPRPRDSEVLAGKELLEAVRTRLTEAERQLADRRAQGRAWTEIAAELGGNPDAMRIRLTRALDRVAAELRLDE